MIVAFSRRFPPDFKRKWYIRESHERYFVRYNGRTWTNTIFYHRNHALDVIMKFQQVESMLGAKLHVG